MTVRSGKAGSFAFVETTLAEEIDHGTVGIAFGPGSPGYYTSNVSYQTSWENPLAISTLSKYLTSIPSQDAEKIVSLLEDNARSLEDHLDTAYLKISGGTVYGDVAFSGNIDLFGTTFLGGKPIISLLPPTGSITAFAGTVLPPGYLWCDGSAKLIDFYPALYEVCGSIYAPETATDFYLPNLSGRFPLGDSGSTTPGDTGGASTVTLTSAEMPAHTHDQNAFGVSNAVSGVYTSNGFVVGGAGANDTGGGRGNTTTGGGGAHNNMPPYLVLNYIIKY